MPLFGGSDGPKLKLTRPVIIMMAVLGGLLVIVIVLAILLSSGAFRGRTVAKPPAPTATVKVAQVEGTTAVPPTAPPTVPPAAATSVPTSAPQATQGPTAAQPVATATPVPAPTVDTSGGGAVVQGTPGGAGGGEPEPQAEMPKVSSGLPWLIPVGVLLLVAVVWWRWRRARVEG